jgi:hypothetical protein
VELNPEKNIITVSDNLQQVAEEELKEQEPISCEELIELSVRLTKELNKDTISEDEEKTIYNILMVIERKKINFKLLKESKVG